MTEASSIFVRLDGRDVGLSTLLQKVDAQTQKSADNALRMQAAYARLSAAQGNTAQATGILTNALQNNGGASERVVVSLSQQLATVERGPTAYQQFGQAAKSNLLGIVGPAAAATAVISGLISVGRSFIDAFQFKATLDANRAAVDTSLTGIRDQGQLWAEAAQFADRYKLTQQQTTEAIQASIPVLRTSSASIGEVEATLLRLQAKKPEKTFADAARALDELRGGQITSIVQQFNISRDAANKMKDEIAGGADAVQVLSKYLTSAGYGMEVLENRTKGAQGAMNDLAVAQEKVTLAQGQLATSAGAIAATQEYGTVLQGLANLLNGDITTGYKSWGINIAASQAAEQAHTAATAAGRTETEAAAIAAKVYADVVRQASEAEGLGAAATTTHTKAVIEHLTAEQLAAQKTAEAGAALADETQKKLDSAQAAQQLAQFQATLASLGGAVAGGLQTAANAAALLASQYHIAYGEALNLINAQAALAQAKVNAAALADQRAGERSPGASGAAEAAAQEERSLQALYRTLQDAPKKARAGGGTKLSDQQKLNNTLLADQEKANTQFEDAEAAHQQRLLKIAIDFAKKTLEQQKANEISKRQSAESFYDRLTSSELNKSKAGTDALRQIDAQYQADRQKAEELAQQGKAKQSADLLALAQKQAQDEIDYQEKVAKAQADKDKAEVDRLAAIHKLHQDTAAEERKQVLEGGDANVNARQQAIDDETQSYADQQEKIGTSAERAATRQETAALRAGKAIDAVNTKLGVTKSTYDQIAPSGGGNAPATTTNASGPPSTNMPAAAPGAPGDAVVLAIADLKPLLAAIERATNSGADRVANALRVKIAS